MALQRFLTVTERTLRVVDQGIRIYDQLVARGRVIRDRYQEYQRARQRVLPNEPDQRRNGPARGPNRGNDAGDDDSDEDGPDLPPQHFEMQNAIDVDLAEYDAQLDILREALEVAIERHRSAQDANDQEVALFYTQQISRELYRAKSPLPALLGRKNIIEAIQGPEQFILVRGETGSGKSTQLPQYIAEMDEFRTKKIICTQPRSIAASMLAKRVGLEWAAGEKDCDHLKKEVIHQTERRLSDTAKIQFFNESTLISLISDEESGKMLNPDSIGVIIIDEAHERSINTDLLIGILKSDRKWSRTKVIITSASLDIASFRRFLSDCPLIEIPGKTYPVTLSWRPSVSSLMPDKILYQAVKATLMAIRENPGGGDILVFLTSQIEVERACELLMSTVDQREKRKLRCYPLYGRQPPEEQNRVFEPTPSGKRKIIFSTDVAETSITIDHLKIVIDMGLCKTALYDAVKNVTSLCVVPISKSSAQQRKGRVGRTGPGICYRYYSEDEYLKWAEGEEPEILRRSLDVSLASLLRLNIRNPNDFAWIDPPEKENVTRSLERLELFGALQSVSQLLTLSSQQSARSLLTPIGNLVVSLQMDPGQVAMIRYAASQGYATCGAILAAVAELGNSALWSDQENRDEARRAHMALRVDDGGDLVTYYHIFQKWSELKQKRGRQHVDWATENFINNKKMGQVDSKSRDIIKQLKNAKQWAGGDGNAKRVPPTTELLLKLSLRMFLPNIAINIYQRQYHVLSGASRDNSPESIVSMIHPSSLVASDLDPPAWVMYHSVLSTSRSFLIQVTPFKIEWLKEIHPVHYERALLASQKYRIVPLEIPNISPVLQARLLGENGVLRTQVINELQCHDIEANPEKLSLTFWARGALLASLKSSVDDRLNRLRVELRNKVELENHANGPVRLVMGSGLRVLELLTRPPADEFLAFEIPNLPPDTHEPDIRAMVTNVLTNQMRDVDLEIAIREISVHTRNRTARVVLFPSQVAIRAKFYLTNIDRNAINNAWQNVIVRPVENSKGSWYQPPFRSRLVFTGYTRNSTGNGTVRYKRAQNANHFLTQRILKARPMDPDLRKARQNYTAQHESPNKLLGVYINGFGEHYTERRLVKYLCQAEHAPKPELITITRDNPTDIQASSSHGDHRTGPRQAAKSTDVELQLSGRHSSIKTNVLTQLKELIENRALNYEGYIMTHFDKRSFKISWTVSCPIPIDVALPGTPANLLKHDFEDNFDPKDGWDLYQPEVYQIIECVLSIPKAALHVRKDIIERIKQGFLQKDPFNTFEPHHDPHLANLSENRDSISMQLTSPLDQFLATSDDRTQLNDLVRKISAQCNPIQVREMNEIIFNAPGLVRLSALSQRHPYLSWDFARRYIYYWTEDPEKCQQLEQDIAEIEYALKSVQSDHRIIAPQMLESVTKSLSKDPNFIKKKARAPDQIEMTEIRDNTLWIWGTKISLESLTQNLESEGYILPRRLQRRQEAISAPPSSSMASSSTPIASSSSSLPLNLQKLPDQFECSICLENFDFSDRNVICLSLCCHRFCSSCLVDHITSYDIGSPLICPDRECDETLTHYDLQNLIPVLSPLPLVRLREGAINSFLLNHRDTYRRCPKAGCQQLLRLIDCMGAKRGECSSCHLTYCFSCSKDGEAVSHPEGSGCLAWENTNGSALRRRALELLNPKCPRCEAVFLDFFGCFCVQCGQCQIHFCAFCLREHGDSQTIHRHVRQCGQNPGGDFWGTQEQFTQMCRDRARSGIINLLNTQCPTQREAIELLRSLATDLRQVQIHISEADIIPRISPNQGIPAVQPRAQPNYVYGNNAYNQAQPNYDRVRRPAPAQNAPPRPQNPQRNEGGCVIL